MSAAAWDDFAEPLGEQIAADLRDMARQYEEGRPRTQQRAAGPSTIASPCSRCLARHVLGCPVKRAFDDPWCRIIGTATHTWLDEAAEEANIRENRARWLPELTVQPDVDLLPKGGKLDLYDVDRKTVIDHKIVGAEPLKKYRHNGPGEQYRGQVHLYGLGYANAGHEVENVAVAFWNRGGKLRDLYVWVEPFNPDLALEKLARYRTIRDLALSTGKAILPLLPADPSCWDCGGAEVTPEEMTSF